MIPPPPSEGREGRALSYSVRLYRTLLGAYPEGFRRAHGAEMVQVFRVLCAETLRRDGLHGLLKLWARTLLDLLSTALAERSGLVVGSSKVVWWGGLAALGGGFLWVAAGVLLASAMRGGLAPSNGFLAAIGLSLDVGYLLFFGGITGLVRAMVRVGGTVPTRTGRPRRLSLAQATALVGLVLAAVAFVASVAYAALALAFWPLWSDGPPGSPGSFILITLSAISTTRTLGLSLATVLLGIAAWHSGILGRLKALPLVVGLLTGLAHHLTGLLFSLVVDHNRSLPSLPEILLFVLPYVVIGLGWMLLGYALWSTSGENGVQREGDEMGQPRIGGAEG